MGGYYLNSAGVTTDWRVTSRFGTGRTALCAPPGGRDWKYGTIGMRRRVYSKRKAMNAGRDRATPASETV